MLVPCWKRHLSIKKIKPYHDDPSIFITCQWQKDKTKPNLKYLIYRTIIMLIFLITWLISIILDSGNGKWAIYLTNWGYTGCTLQAVLAFIMLTMAVLATYSEKLLTLKTRTMNLYPVYWILNTVATPTAFAITIVYWSVIYDSKTNKFDAMNYFVHGNNTILMFMDMWIVSHPIQILHLIYTIVLGVVYVIFTLIYFLAGGTNKNGSRSIYKIVDWTKADITTGVCIGVIVFLVVMHMLMILIASLRKNLEEKCFKTQTDKTMMARKEQATYINHAMAIDVV